MAVETWIERILWDREFPIKEPFVWQMVQECASGLKGETALEDLLTYWSSSLFKTMADGSRLYFENGVWIGGYKDEEGKAHGCWIVVAIRSHDAPTVLHGGLSRHGLRFASLKNEKFENGKLMADQWQEFVAEDLNPFMALDGHSITLDVQPNTAKKAFTKPDGKVQRKKVVKDTYIKLLWPLYEALGYILHKGKPLLLNSIDVMNLKAIQGVVANLSSELKEDAKWYDLINTELPELTYHAPQAEAATARTHVDNWHPQETNTGEDEQHANAESIQDAQASEISTGNASRRQNNSAPPARVETPQEEARRLQKAARFSEKLLTGTVTDDDDWYLKF
jgi:hypothetical protein